MKCKETKCGRCGNCCKAIPCGIALALIGDYRPCAALEVASGGYACGLVLHASKYVYLGENAGWKDEFLGALFGHMLGIGMGCCSSPETELIERSLRMGKKEAMRPVVTPAVQGVEVARSSDGFMAEVLRVCGMGV